MTGDHWTRMPLGEFVTLQRGHDLPDDRRRSGSVPVLGSFGVTGWHDEAKARGPGVTVGRSGASFGVVSYSPVDFWPLNTALYVVDFHGNDERFAYYFLKCFDFRGFNSGSAQPSLNRNFVHPVPVDVPPLPEQRAIAHILGTLDDKIELNRRMNETLEAIARALFASWFVDFDPVRAKVEGRDPGLPKPLADLFPDSFEASKLGEIPKGWRVGKVGDFARLSRDGVSPGAFPDEVFEHFSIPAFDEDHMPRAERGADIKSNKFLVPADAVLLSKLNPRIPRVWLPVVHGKPRAVCSTEFLVTQPRPGISREFLYTFLSTEAFGGLFETLVTGTSGSHQRVRPEGLLDTDAVIPPEPCVEQFSQAVRPLLTREDAGRDESRNLTSLRDALLTRLLSGKLRIGETERFIGGEVP